MTETLPSFLEDRRVTLRHDLGFSKGEDFAKWRERALCAYRKAVEGHDATAVGTLSRSETREGGGERRFYSVSFAHGAIAEAVCLLPPNLSGQPLPAVLLLHDHGGSFTCGWDKMVDPTGTTRMAHAAESLEWVDRYYGGRHLGDYLCNQGFAVLCVDALGWGERATGEGMDGQQRFAAIAMQLGLSLAGLVAAEDAQALRWLCDQPFVDSNRVAVAGFSFGGYRAWQVTSLTGLPAATVSLGWMARRAGMMVPGTGLLRGKSAFYMLHPALGGRLDFPDMAGAGAGCPTFVRVGDRDANFPADAVLGAISDLEAIWTAAGAADRLDAALFSGKHECPVRLQDEAVGFLDRQFGRTPA